MITVRKIMAEDVAEITVLSHQLGYLISTQQSMQNINALMQSEHHAVFVAVDKKVIGWIGVSYNISLESPPMCEIHGLVIHEQYRNKGIGKMLVEKAKEWSTSKGINKLRLRCNIKRTDAHRFYINAGFTEIKQQKVFEINI
jgi:GNAT superfamily N-acetyltransferase